MAILGFSAAFHGPEEMSTAEIGDTKDRPSRVHLPWSPTPRLHFAGPTLALLTDVRSTLNIFWRSGV